MYNVMYPSMRLTDNCMIESHDFMQITAISLLNSATQLQLNQIMMRNGKAEGTCDFQAFTMCVRHQPAVTIR